MISSHAITNQLSPAAATGSDLGQTSVANALRAAGAGYAAAAHQPAVVVEKAAIVPFEGVMTLTGALKRATAHVPHLNKVTSVLNTVTGYAMLIGTATISGSIAAQGNTTSALLDMAANAIDGRGARAAAPQSVVGDALRHALEVAHDRDAAQHA